MKKRPQTEPPTLLSVSRFAQRVDLSERTIWRLIEEGLLTVYRVRRRTLVDFGEGVAAIKKIGHKV